MKHSNVLKPQQSALFPKLIHAYIALYINLDEQVAYFELLWIFIMRKWKQTIKEEKLQCERDRAEKLQVIGKAWTPQRGGGYLSPFFLKDTGHSSYPTLKVNNDTISDDQKKAQIFNDFFLERSRIIINDDQAPLPDAKCHAGNTLSRQKDSEDLLKSLDITKATRSDKIWQVMLETARDVIVPRLTRLFNLFFKFIPGLENEQTLCLFTKRMTML